jgi:hypothetical protein
MKSLNKFYIDLPRSKPMLYQEVVAINDLLQIMEHGMIDMYRPFTS